jgi:MerR family transcriptional regulator, light-induced transcriptional regulator
MAERAALKLPYRDIRPSAESGIREAQCSSGDVRSGVEEAIRSFVGPELLRRHRNPNDQRAPSQTEIRRLATLSIGSDEAAFRRCFEEVSSRNRALEATLVDFVTPAAHWLDELWKEDACSFFDVTIGVGRLQALMDDFASQRSAPLVHPPRRALLVTLADDTHMFGVHMVGKLFEAAGWDVVLDATPTEGASADRVSSEWFAVVGFSIGTAARIATAARIISRVRRISLNPRIGVLVGGAALSVESHACARCGADGFGADAPAAVAAAQSLLRNQVRPQTS